MGLDRIDDGINNGQKVDSARKISERDQKKRRSGVPPRRRNPLLVGLQENRRDFSVGGRPAGGQKL